MAMGTKKCARVICGLLALLLITASAGCRSDGATAERAHRPTSSTSVVHNDPPGAPEGLGMACGSVKDCPSFLSCVDKACAMPASLRDSPGETTPRLEVVTGEDAGVASFYLELAISPDEHAKGLMFRRELPDDWGMLFIYPADGVRSFWMHNTYIPLDMLFIDASGEIVHIIAEAEPLTRTPRTSPRLARYVLELRGGRAAEAGVEVGQRVRLTHVDARHDVKP